MFVIRIERTDDIHGHGESYYVVSTTRYWSMRLVVWGDGPRKRAANPFARCQFSPGRRHAIGAKVGRR